MRAFNYNDSTDVTFQRYDPEWEEFVDLELDSVLGIKEKIRAIITPPITTASCNVLEYVSFSP